MAVPVIDGLNPSDKNVQVIVAALQISSPSVTSLLSVNFKEDPGIGLMSNIVELLTRITPPL